MAKILTLGGTGFVGRILSEKISTSEHELTLFNRCKRNPGILPNVRRITGDRLTAEIEKISKENWDIIFDFSAYFPPNVKKIVEMMKGKVGRYIFISSGSVYSYERIGRTRVPFTEGNEVLSCTNDQAENLNPRTHYGEKKAECERILQQAGFDVIIFRPGVIYGRYDPSDRLYYWLSRIICHDCFLIPDNGKSLWTYTYSEDFADILLNSISLKSHRTVYNAPTCEPQSLISIINCASKILERKPKLVSASAEFLKENGVAEWTDLPMWLADYDIIIDNSRLVEDFKPSLRPFEQSVKESIDYYRSLGFPKCKAGLTREKEERLIKKLGTKRINIIKHEHCKSNA